MKNKINDIKQHFINELKNVSSLEQLSKLNDDLLGKKWALNDILKGLKDLNDQERKEVGLLANELKEFIKSESTKKEAEIEHINYSKIEDQEKIDVTLNFESKQKGHLHPISLTSKILEDIFISLGFKVEDGPQIETEEFNFDKLNIPDNHPARDVWDTFWIHDEINADKKVWDRHLLRTHTSPVQIRTMMNRELPIKIIVPGRVFRYEQEDARHTSNFYQLEGLVVGKGVTFGDLKWTLDTVMKKLLWEQTKLRFRPSIFPFTEPSAEIDVSCQLCNGNGCKMCSGTGWVELLWAGMVHPKVLKACNVDPEVYSGFAFGMWIDRIAAQRYSVSSSRMFYQNKLKLNEQF